MEYIQGLDGQISVFLHSLGIGFLLGVFYDAVCAVRAVLPGGRKVIFVTDILYVIVCAFASFCFILVLNDGRTLLYILAAQLLGFAAERLSLGAAAKHFVKAQKALLADKRRCQQAALQLKRKNITEINAARGKRGNNVK